MNGYNFTERVRTSLSLAREEAARMHHPYVSAEHILLGIVREGEGVAMTVVQNLGVPLPVLEHAVTSRMTGIAAVFDNLDLPYDDGAKKVLELSMSQARDLGHKYVGTEHALLALIAEGGRASVALRELGVTLESARAEMRRILGETEVATRPAAAQSEPTPSSRLADILRDARRVAAERRATEVSAVHMAIALLELDGGMANVVLDRLALDRTAAMNALNELAPLGPHPTAPSALSPEALSAIDHASQHSKVGRSDYVLLGLIMASAAVSRVFEAHGITSRDVLEEIRYISG